MVLVIDHKVREMSKKGICRIVHISNVILTHSQEGGYITLWVSTVGPTVCGNDIKVLLEDTIIIW